MTSDRRVDGATGRIGMALHQCVIALVDGARLEGALEHRVRAFRERHHHDTGGADVESMHDALTLMDSRRADAETRRGQAAEHRRSVPADRGVRSDTRRFVDRDDVGVRVENLHALDLDGRILHRRRRFRQAYFQPGPGDQLVGFPRGRTVDVDAAVFGQCRRSRPRQSEEPRQTRVDAHACQPFRDRHRAGGHSDESPVRRPTVSKSKPNSDSATSRIAPPTTDGRRR